MKFSSTFFFAMQLTFLPSLVTIVHADNSGFPPAYTANQNSLQQFPVQPQNSYNVPNMQMQQAPQVQRFPNMMQTPQNYQQQRYLQQYPQYNSRSIPSNQVNRALPNTRSYLNTNNNNFPLSNNMMPFGNATNNGFNPFSNGNMPFSNNSGMMPSNPMNNMFGNSNNSSMPFFPSTNNKKRKKAWGTERNIWPDFYTDFTDEAWDQAMSGPRELGTMPGGWRFPYISMPDPVTVSDAITNQFPPIAEEAGNMADFSDWGIFD